MMPNNRPDDRDSADGVMKVTSGPTLSGVGLLTKAAIKSIAHLAFDTIRHGPKDTGGMQGT